MEGKVKGFRISAIILLIIASIFFYQAVDKKINYSSGESSYKSENAYVGGDAYNFIINASYFTGYVVLGCSTTLVSVSLYISSIFIELELEKRKLLKEDKSTLKQAELPEI